MRNRPVLPLLLLAFVLPLSAAEPAELAWPAITRDHKPWTRWWWLGNIGDAHSFTSEMEKYAAAGLGGLEITPIYGVRGAEDRFVPFLSDRWVGNLEHVLKEGRRLDLGIDLATGTGWPFGGPWIEGEDAAHYLAHRTFTVASGGTLGEPVQLVQKPLLRFAGRTRVPIADLREPVTANANLQELAIDQVRFPRPLPLVSLMAYPGAGADRAPLDLTSRVAADGRLDWTAPADRGTWTLYALFQGQHGKMVERAAPAAEGYALDHLSSRALARYLAEFDRALTGRATKGIRAWFNDSYEVDDGEGESDFTPRFFAEFTRLRGYDLRTQLPALFDPADSRVLADYRETVSDLLLEQFTVPWREWANRHGALIRNQAHNAPANILDLYAASDIPEQEGNGHLAMKMASSVAHVTGKPLASAETATWLNEHFLSTLAELKATVDGFLLAGINHNCYHGTPFSPPDEPWPGYHFYASVELSPVNPIWRDFAAVNAYVARAQSFLQSGQPDEDLLLYYNIHDRWAVRGTGEMPHFGHGRDPLGVDSLRETATRLVDTGVGFDYISDRQIQGLEYRGKLIESGRQGYHAVLVPPTKFMPLATLAHLVALAERGATILVEQALPTSAPGHSGRLQQKEFDQLLARLTARALPTGGITRLPVGKGEFIVGPDATQLLAIRPGIPRESLTDHGLEFVRRRTDHGFLYFIANRSDRPVNGWVPLQAHGQTAALFDPATGRLGRAAARLIPAQPSQVYLQLPPGESVIVTLENRELTGPAWAYWQDAGETQPLAGTWGVRFADGGPTLPPATTVPALKSWTDFGGDELKRFSGHAAYTLRFAKPAGPAPAWRLDLGRVAESARVSLNGREIATLWQTPYAVVIPAGFLAAENTLEISVANLAANRIADLDRRGVNWKKFYNANMPARFRENTGPDGLFSAAQWAPRPSGLLGPVTLTPLRRLDPR
ncbi:glycoside hydrolase family 2 protein [Oleiharenicola lentus]|uniref:Glycoside hydrolase family 2 protein n=1 Tax=Oleiharenicola lentus TaxID=2508720 RepID=A0A4Q1C6X0_9BACT|nr:glycosyl hydrolase [Oleiharenicola lentus]RXK54540.1 glycoside hydrolase family 2 protein [Oleiharenicola lentus]